MPRLALYREYLIDVREIVRTAMLALGFPVVRFDIAIYRYIFVENTVTRFLSTISFTLKSASPLCSPTAFASGVSATMMPSLLDSTHTGFPCKPGWKTFSHEQKNELQSTRAYILSLIACLVYDICDYPPDAERIPFGYRETGKIRIGGNKPSGAVPVDGHTLEGIFPVEFAHGNLLR